MTMKKKILPLLLASILATAGCADTKNMDINNSGSTSDTGSENGGSQGGGTDSSDGTGSASGQSGGSSDETGGASENDGSSGGTGSASENGGSSGGSDGAGSQGENAAGNTDSTASNPGSRVSASDLFSERDMESGYEEDGSAAISLNGESAACSSNAVKISGSTITITDEGTYILSGTLQDGMVIVDADQTDKVQIVLKGAEIASSTSAAVYVRQADKVFLTTAADTENTLSNGGAYEAVDDNNIDAVIFSKDDLTLNGTGSLKINAQAGHGIVSKDDLVLTGGSYDITAASHGLSGKDSVCIADGDFQITAGKDGIHTENTDDASRGFLFISDGEFEITSEGDGISSSYFGQIEGGSFNIQAGGGAMAAALQSGQDAGSEQPAQMIHAVLGSQAAETMLDRQAVPDSGQAGAQAEATTSNTDTSSTKGIKAGGNLWLDGGTFVIDSADDALHTNSSIEISGGSYQIASGDDGIHADDGAGISDGKIDISQSFEGIEGKTIDISGGEISLAAEDDGLNAAGGADSSGFGTHKDSFASSEGVYISISGGKLYVKASGDGIDSNGDLTIKGGETYVYGPSGGGNGSLDYNGQASVTGGIFAASGAMGMVQNFDSSSTQGAMLVQTDGGAEGDAISLADADGNVLVSWQAETAYGCVIVSCPGLIQGNTYTLTAGGTSSQIEMTSLIYGQGSGAGRGAGGMDGSGRGSGGMDGAEGSGGMNGAEGSGGMDGSGKGSGGMGGRRGGAGRMR